MSKRARFRFSTPPRPSAPSPSAPKEKRNGHRPCVFKKSRAGKKKMRISDRNIPMPCGYATGVTYTSPVTYTSQIPDIDNPCHDDQIVPKKIGLETLNSYIRDFFCLELNDENLRKMVKSSAEPHRISKRAAILSESRVSQTLLREPLTSLLKGAETRSRG